MNIKIHRFLPFTKVEGPGNRACIWVQGCPIRCKGCALPQTWDFEGGENRNIDELLKIILSTQGIEGVTFMGGEPFAQAQQVAYMAKKLQEKKLSVVVFTGYNYEQLKNSSDKYWQELLNSTDLLIDGPYDINKKDYSRPWVGSSNQNYYFLTDRYSHLKDKLERINNKLEIRIQPNGKIMVNGMVDLEQFDSLFAGTARKE